MGDQAHDEATPIRAQAGGRHAQPPLLRGTVICYWCGHVSGAVTVDTVLGPQWATFTPLDEEPGTEAATRPVRCHRCHGPTMIEDLQPIPRPGAALVVRGRLRRPKGWRQQTEPQAV